LAGLLMANVAFAAGLFVHAFLYNFYLEWLGFSPLVMGRAQAALTAGGLVALLPAGRLVDRAGPRQATLLASLVTATGLLASAFAETELSIYAASLVAGAGAASWRVAGGPLLLQVATPAQRARAFSWNVGLLVAAGGALFFAAGALSERLLTVGVTTPLEARRLVLAVFALVTAAAVLLYARLPAVAAVPRRATPAPNAAPSSPTSAGWSDRALAVATLAIFVWMLASAVAGPFFNLYFARAHGLTLTATGALLGAGHVVTALALLASAEVAQRRGPSFALGLWLAVLPPALLALALGPGLTIAVVLYAVQGFTAPATNPLIDQLVLEHAAPERRGRAASWRNTATEASGAVGAAVGGAVLAAASFGALFAAAGVIAVVGAAALGFALRWRR
jgi:MFS family permease